MKFLILLIILLSFSFVKAQENQFDSKIPAPLQLNRSIQTTNRLRSDDAKFELDDAAVGEFEKMHGRAAVFTGKSKIKRQDFDFLKEDDDENNFETDAKVLLKSSIAKINFSAKYSDDSAKNGRAKFHWKPALIQSGIFLTIQHGFRMFQKRTNSELGGPFFADWKNSVKNLRGWRDGDIFIVNYVAHPMQGAATGRIFINNSDKSKKLEFGSAKDYWTSRLKAMAWSAAWSTQFELGPVSEATIGNVGLHDNVGRSRMAWVDLVITPTAGTGVLIGEDIIDKYVLKNWLEKKITSRTKIKVYRTFLNPLTSFTNVIGGKKPWQRYNR